MRLRLSPPLAFLFLGLPLLLVGACHRGEDRQTARRVILITCDTLRADRLGLYGFERATSPELDAFARDAIVFDRAYSAAPLTLPSVCSMLTGRLPSNIGVEHNRQFLQATVRTIAEALSEQRISTAAVVSNWVLVNPPSMPASFGVRQGFAHFDETMLTREAVRGMPERRAAATTKATIDWLDEQKAKENDRFFLWVHYQDPHGPYTPPQNYIDMLARPLGDEPPLPASPDAEGRGNIPSYQMLGGETRPEFYRIRYEAEIRFFDDQLGRLLRHLEESDLLADSLIIFSADHGESLGEHDYWFSHGEHLNRELLHVPLVVRYPDGMPHPRAEKQGDYRRVSQVVDHLDIFPTVLSALGVDPGPGAGTSLITRTLPADRVAVQMLGYEDGRKIRTVTDGRWRLHFEEGQAPRLYDLEADAGEEDDVAPAHADVVRRLRQSYAEYLTRDTAESVEGKSRTLSDEERRIMNGLGYTDAGGAEDD